MDLYIESQNALFFQIILRFVALSAYYNFILFYDSKIYTLAILLNIKIFRQ